MKKMSVHPIVVAAERIVEHLKRLNRPVVGLLRSGISIKTNEVSPWQLTEEIVALYQWRDGTASQGQILDDMHFFPGFYFMSFDEALENWRAFQKDKRWLPNWFPIFANGGGDFYVLPLPEGNAGECEVVGFMLGESDHFVEYSSLTNMFNTILECYTHEAYFVEAAGYLEVDVEKEHKVSHKLNPQLSRWRG